MPPSPATMMTLFSRRPVTAEIFPKSRRMSTRHGIVALRTKTEQRGKFMAPKKPEAKGGVPVHAELARMEADGVDVAGVIALAGYVGAPPSEGVVRLHPGLEDLSVSLDISRSEERRVGK